MTPTMNVKKLMAAGAAVVVTATAVAGCSSTSNPNDVSGPLHAGNSVSSAPRGDNARAADIKSTGSQTISSNTVYIAPAHDLQVTAQCPAGYWFDQEGGVSAHGSYIHLDEWDHPESYIQGINPTQVPGLGTEPTGATIWLYNASIDPTSYGYHHGWATIDCEPIG